MDTLNIPKTEGVVNRDALQALCRRNSFLVNHEDAERRHQDLADARAIANDPTRQEELAAAKDDEKRHNRDLKAEAKFQAQQARQEANEMAKAQEKIRQAGLSPEEKKQERAAKKEAADIKRTAKAEEKLANIQARQARLQVYHAQPVAEEK